MTAQPLADDKLASCIMERPRFPPELCDLIIDFLYNSSYTLRACALVCRSWLPTSRSHLFSKVHINNLDLGTKTLTEVLGSGLATNVGQYIIFVSVSIFAPIEAEDYLYEALEALQHSATPIQLRIETHDEGPLPNDLVALLTSFPTIKHLGLHRIHAEPVSRLLQTYGPYLRQLTLGGIFAHPGLPVDFPKLTRLRLGPWCGRQSIVALLGALPVLESLAVFDLGGGAAVLPLVSKTLVTLSAMDGRPQLFIFARQTNEASM